MSKFKVGDEVEAVSESFTWGLVRAGDLGVVKSLRGDEYFVRFPNQSTWRCYEKDLKLVKPKWTIYNNTLPWSQLSDKQKGKLLLAGNEGVEMTLDGDIVNDAAFKCKKGVYKAIKPEPTMEELFDADSESFDFRGSGDFPEYMIAKGWTKTCK